MIVKEIHNYKLCIDEKIPGIQDYLRNWKPGTIDREPAFEYLIRQEVKPGMTVLELGANVGYLTFMMWSNLAGNGKIYGFEPDPRNYKILNESVILNNAENVEVYPYAVDNIDGEIDFNLGIASNLSSIRPTKSTSGETVKVETVRLDTFFKDKPHPNFIKMDIEGHEVEALKSGLEIFSQKFPCKILMEVHPTLLDGNAFENVCRELLDLGFHYKFVISAGVPQPDLYKEKGYEPIKVFPGSPWRRGLYDNITDDDAILFSCYEHKQKYDRKRWTPKICRSVMLER